MFSDSADRKRKNVPTGYAEEWALSHSTFKSQHRAFESHAKTELENRKRQKKGDAGVVSGPNSYKGPWAKYEEDDLAREVDGEESELASDEEYIDEAIVPAMMPAIPQASTAYRDNQDTQETSVFEGSQQTDYQGRTYMHVPQDLGINLRDDNIPKNYIPKKIIHTWRSHTGAIKSLRFFPNSGHLLLSASADMKVKLFDVYHDRELLRTYSGHTSSLTGANFNRTGTHFITGSHDRMMKLWDTETGQCTSKFTTGKTPHVIRFHPSIENEHVFLAGMSDNKIVQFDTRSGEMTQEYDHHLGPVNTLTWVDEDRRFITTSDDKSLRACKYLLLLYTFPCTLFLLHLSAYSAPLHPP